ncbi:mitochondrial import inner membrane translocase subunit PAM16 like 2-like isoform X1 [Musa acuminata AAA Group]
MVSIISSSWCPLPLLSLRRRGMMWRTCPVLNRPASTSLQPVAAARILANLLVMGSGILGRAVLQAYRKALENANKTGVANETIQNIRRASKAMTEQEARQILGINEQSTWEEILKKYDVLFERNAKHGSFYLQSKVHRAKECLEAVYQGKG